LSFSCRSLSIFCAHAAQIKRKHRHQKSTHPHTRKDPSEWWSTRWGGFRVWRADLDVDGLLGALLLVQDAALAVAEEAPGRRGGRGVAEARGEGGQRGSHRHGSAAAAAGLGWVGLDWER
jgi:hypothetical protein